MSHEKTDAGVINALKSTLSDIDNESNESIKQLKELDGRKAAFLSAPQKSKVLPKKKLGVIIFIHYVWKQSSILNSNITSKWGLMRVFHVHTKFFHNASSAFLCLYTLGTSI